MSKGYSGHFNKTQGARYGTGTVASAQRVAVAQWAKQKLASLGKRKAKDVNTAAVAFDESTGKMYFGVNKGISLNRSKRNPIIFGDGERPGLLPRESLNNYPLGNCAEVDAINSALNDGARLENLHIYTIHATKGKFGQPKCACENCTYAFKGRIKTNNSGWSK